MSDDLMLMTGASSDIGIALMRHLLCQANPCRILAQDHQHLDRCTELQAEFPGRVIPLQADLSEHDSTAALAAAVTSFGVPSVMVHLPARKLVYERFTKLDWASFHTDMTIQVEAAMVLLQRLFPKMAKLPRSRVVFVLSSVVHGMPPKFLAALQYASLPSMYATHVEPGQATSNRERQRGFSRWPD